MFIQTKEEAEKAADQMKALMPKGWKSRVWENHGSWHAAVEKRAPSGGGITIYYEGKTSYYAVADNDYMAADNPVWSSNEACYKDPVRAYREKIKLIKQYQQRLNKFVEEVTKE